MIEKEAVRVADEIRSQIYKGLLRAGDKLLSEKDLLAHFGVSRPTLREALRLLEFEQLISITRGSGGVRVGAPVTASLSRQAGGFLQRQGASLEDIYAARIHIEPICAGLLAVHASPQAIDAMELNIAESLGARGQRERFDALIVAFSRLVVENCGNRSLALLGAILQEIMQSQIVFLDTSLIYKASDAAREREDRITEERENLLQAVRDRDAARAADVWRRRLVDSRDYLLSAYNAQLPIEIVPAPLAHRRDARAADLARSRQASDAATAESAARTRAGKLIRGAR